MKTSIYNPRGMGAIPLEGSTHFRVWAPNANSVSVVGEFNNWDAAAHPLEREDGGMWAARSMRAKAGQQYQFEIINGDLKLRKNDAYARANSREIRPLRYLRRRVVPVAIIRFQNGELERARPL